MSASEVYRPPDAGTKETPNYADHFNKQKLKNLTGMFEAKKDSNQTNGYVKSERVVKPSSSIGNLKSKFSTSPSKTQNISYAPDYSTFSTNVESKTKPEQSSNKDVIKTIAGQREVAEYVPTVSLSAAKAMFSKTTADEYKPRNKVKVAPKTTRVAENGKEVVRNADIIDDRPTSLTTSLANAKSMFENNNEPTETKTIQKEVPSWEGKETAKSKMNSAKTVFQISENDSPPPSTTRPKPIVLPTETPEKLMAEKDKIENNNTETEQVDENIEQEQTQNNIKQDENNLKEEQKSETNDDQIEQEDQKEESEDPKEESEDQKEESEDQKQESDDQNQETEDQKEKSEEQVEESEKQIEETIDQQNEENTVIDDALEQQDASKVVEKEIEHSSLVNEDVKEGDGKEVKVNQVEEPSKQNTTKSYDSNDVLSDASTSSDGQNKYMEDSSTK